MKWPEDLSDEEKVGVGEAIIFCMDQNQRVFGSLHESVTESLEDRIEHLQAENDALRQRIVRMEERILWLLRQLSLARGPCRSPRLGPEAWSNHPGSRGSTMPSEQSSALDDHRGGCSGTVVLRPSLTGRAWLSRAAITTGKSGWRRTRSIGSSTPTRPSRRREFDPTAAGERWDDEY